MKKIWGSDINENLLVKFACDGLVFSHVKIIIILMWSIPLSLCDGGVPVWRRKCLLIVNRN